MDIETLKKEIDKLKEEIENLKNSNSIPRAVETAFRERLGDIKEVPGTVSTTLIDAADDVNLPDTVGTLPIVVNGVKYNVLYQ